MYYQSWSRSLSSEGDSNSGQSLIQMRDSDSNSTHLSWVPKITLWTLHDTVVHQLQYAEIISLRLFHKLFLVYADATTGPRNVQVPAALPTFARFTDVLNSAQTRGVDGGLRDEVGAGLRCGRVGVWSSSTARRTTDTRLTGGVDGGLRDEVGVGLHSGRVGVWSTATAGHATDTRLTSSAQRASHRLRHELGLWRTHARTYTLQHAARGQLEALHFLRWPVNPGNEVRLT